MKASEQSKRYVWGIALLLGIITALVYLPTLHHGFVNYDDPYFVSQNAQVQKGLTLETAAWAFRFNHGDYWHPVTWLSLLLDVSLFGRGAGGMHFTNLLLHVANTILLFLLLRQWTGALWRSALVAGLFGLHPLHVEAVAWVTARKDVLSTLFWILTLWAYGRYVSKDASHMKPGASAAATDTITTGRAHGYYWLTLSFFVVGLMSKAMLLTLPFVMLLLDYWPLRRIDLTDSKSLPAQFLRMIPEKIPFFLLTVASSLVTHWGQHRIEIITTPSDSSFVVRIETVLIAYAKYLSKTFWPSNLAVYYPQPAQWPAEEIVIAAATVVGLSLAALLLARRRPYFFVGWFWFLGTLVPVIGLTRGWSQFIADRFTYVPSIGLFIVVAWVLYEIVEKQPQIKFALAGLASAALLLCLQITWQQIHYWKNSEVLFRHAVAVTSNNATAQNALGFALKQSGKLEEALQHFSICAQIDSRNLDAVASQGVLLAELGRVDDGLEILQNAQKTAKNPILEFNIANLFNQKGDIASAEKHYRSAIGMKSDFPDAYYNLALNLMSQSRFDEAERHLNRVLYFRPGDRRTLLNLGAVAAQQGKLDEAIEHLQAALKFDPHDPDTHFNLGKVFLGQGHIESAAAQFSEAVKQAPQNVEARRNLGYALAQGGRLDKAVLQFEEVARLKPDDAQARFDLGTANELEMKPNEAIQRYHQSLELNPDFLPALNNLAWLRATHSDPAVRDGVEAVRCAEHACELTRFEQPILIGTLAAAYAETGQFTNAIATAQKACALAAGQSDLVEKNERLLELYRTRKPYHGSDTVR